MLADEGLWFNDDQRRSPIEEARQEATRRTKRFVLVARRGFTWRSWNSAGCFKRTEYCGAEACLPAGIGLIFRNRRFMAVIGNWSAVWDPDVQDVSLTLGDCFSFGMLSVSDERLITAGEQVIAVLRQIAA